MNASFSTHCPFCDGEVVVLTAYDDLFETDQSCEEPALSKIRDIPIAEIDEFPDHPFKVLMDEDIYLSGIPGDWLISRTENPGDVYIVKKDIFAKTYMPVNSIS